MSTSTTCIHCGAALKRPGIKFCPVCGLSQQAEAAPKPSATLAPPAASAGNGGASAPTSLLTTPPSASGPKTVATAHGDMPGLNDQDGWPQLIVVDEAARLTENLSLVLQAQWQSAFSVYISDTQQFPPIGLTVEQRDFKAVFSYQRQISLFHRMENGGRILARTRQRRLVGSNYVLW